MKTNRVTFSTHASIVGSRKVAIYTAAVVTIIVIFGLLMTRQILFFNVTMETIFFLITVVIAYGVGSWILLGYTRHITKELKSKSRFINIMQLAMTIIQFSLFGILLLAIYNELYYGPYSNNTRYFTTSVYAISIIATTIFLASISFKFFSWYKLTSKKNFMILFFGLAAVFLAISISGDGINKLLILQVVNEKSPPEAVPQSYFVYKNIEKYHGRVQYVVVNPDITTTYVVLSEDQSLYRNINYLASYPPYIFSWIGTVLLLRHFYQRIGKLPVRYWIILTIPLILYLIGSGLIFSLPSDMPYLYYFRILFRAGTIASSILFGLAFYIITRNVNSGKVKDYFAITAIGITIIGIANETSALHQTYGAAVHSLVLLSSYLFTIGLYSAALAISQDSLLRRSIKKNMPESLGDIGTAQMEQELEKRIVKIVEENKKKLEEETGGISYSLTDDDIKEYMVQVIQEKKKS
jgi:MFS family permease